MSNVHYLDTAKVKAESRPHAAVAPVLNFVPRTSGDVSSRQTTINPPADTLSSSADQTQCGSDVDSLPVVDISGLTSEDESVRDATRDRIGNIAMQNGFLYLQNHGVSEKLIDRVYDQSAQFFDRNLAEKSRYYIGNARNHRGYVPVTEKGDYVDEQGPRRYEAFDMGMDHPQDDPGYLSGNPLMGPNVWPQQDGFKSTLTEYLAEMRRLSLMMCEVFEDFLGIERGSFTQHMDRPVSQLRLLHYLENKDVANAANVNMGAHTDYECFTILHSRTASLQVLDLDSKWVDAPPLPNTFYFNIGDMLEAWSGGLFVATPHRVVNKGQERFSLPFFAGTNFETRVSPVYSEKFAAKQKDYAPIVAGEHLLNNMMRDFPYLRRKYESGLLDMVKLEPGDNPFEGRMMESLAGELV